MKNKHKILIPVIIALTLAIVVASVHMGVQQWLNKQLPELLNKNPNRKYNISYTSANLNMFQQNLTINGIEISELTDTLSQSSIQIKQFKVNSLQLKKLFLNKEIVTQELVAEHPVFNIIVRQNKAHQKEEKINEIWTDVFTRLSIKNLEIKNATALLSNDKDTVPALSIENINLKVKGFNVDTTTLKNPLPLHFSSLSANCENTQIQVDTIGLLLIKYIHLTDHSVTLRQSSLIPNLSKTEFRETNRAKDDWLSFDMDRLQMNNFSWAFDSSGVPCFKASSFQLDSMVLHALKDKRYPLEHNGCKPLLAEIFRSLPLKFQLDSFRIINSAVFAETRPETNDTTGVAIFDNLYASGYNLHNNSEIMQDTEFDILCRFMNEARLEAHYVMDVNDEQNRFSLTGSLTNLSTKSVNKILQPLADIETAGQLYGIDFNVWADNKQSTGTVDFEYNHLKIKINSRNSSKKNLILSALSNLALRGSNIRSDRNFRQGEIQFTRDTSKSIFGYVWDSVKDGLMNTLVPFDIEQRKSIFKRKSRR